MYNEVTSTSYNQKLKGSEPVTVDYVTVDVKNKKQLQKVIDYQFISYTYIIISIRSSEINFVIKM